MRRLLVYLKDYKRECVLGPLFKLLEASFELVVPLVVALIIDQGIAYGDRGCVYRMCGVLVLLAAIGLTCSITAQYFAAKAATGFSTKVRHALFAHIEELSFSEIDQIGTSTLITRMTSDINQMQSGVNLVLRLFLRSPFIVVGAMIMAFTVDVQAALVFVVTIPLLSIVVFGVMIATMPMYRKVQAGLDKVLLGTRESLEGARVIRAFHKESEEEERFRADNEHLTDMQIAVGRISALTNPMTYIIVNVATLLVIWVGGRRVYFGYLTQGEVVALVNYMSQILVELVKLANLIVNITKSLASARRVADVLDLEPSIQDGTGIDAGSNRADELKANVPDGRVSGNYSSVGKMADIRLTTGSSVVDGKEIDSRTATDFSTIENTRVDSVASSQASDYNVMSSSVNEPEDNNKYKVERANAPVAVSFSHAFLRYRGAGADALSDIDFTVQKGQTIGVIGGTGSGKSSLVNLIPRFYDVTDGVVEVDGRDVRSYKVSELRDKIGVVMQRAVLFAGTIEENLRWGNPDATEEQLWQALAIAQAEDVVKGKDGGLSYRIEEGGKNLSGGQKQRLTIARAVVKDPEILILDDSASALDFATDARLRHALQNMKGNKTIFIVSQRTSSIQFADRIVVLDDGRAVGIGTHEELLAGCEVYREIYESQFKRRT